MGYRMKQLRHSRQMSREDLEAASGVNRAVISAIEDDPDYTPTIRTLERLAAALGSTVDQIFFA